MKKNRFFICSALLLCSTTMFGQTIVQQTNFTSISAANKAAAKNVTLTGTLSTNGNSDFRQLRDLGYQIESINLTNSNCPNIPNNALMCKHTLKTLKLPNNLLSIGSQAFIYCDSMTTIGTIPSKVQTIGVAAFANCKKLETLKFSVGSALINMGSYAFVNDSALSGTIAIPTGVRVIRQGTFARCPKISSVHLPNELQSIEAQAFDGCSSLTSINLGRLITDIGASAFSGCKLLTELTLPRALQRIQSCAFKDCGLKNIITPVTTNTIEEGAFENCKDLSDVTLLGTITNIPAMTFANCSSLKIITLATTTPPSVDVSAFTGLETSSITLQVYENAVENYKQAAIWKDFNIKAVPEITGIANKEANNCKIAISNNVLSITNISLGTMVKVYNAKGQLIAKSGKTTKSFNTKLVIHDTYIVSVGDKEYKITF